MSNSQPQISSQPAKNAYVYVDGFNLYYGALNKKSLGLKWLNLESLCQKLFPTVNIKKIKYFTAGVSGKFDVNKPVRQRTYWRALKTISDLEIIEGRFLIVPKKIHITQDVCVIGKGPEEKGTDVNLAIHLVNDAHLKNLILA